jgi:hypothetical protein
VGDKHFIVDEEISCHGPRIGRKDQMGGICNDLRRAEPAGVEMRLKLRHRGRVDGRSRPKRVGGNASAKLTGDAERHEAHAEFRNRVGFLDLPSRGVDRPGQRRMRFRRFGRDCNWPRRELRAEQWRGRFHASRR